MSSHTTSQPAAPLDLSRWRNLPMILIVVGALAAVGGFVLYKDHAIYSWLLAFMFAVSLGLGAFFLVLCHHMFDAAWSVPIRRTCEHLAVAVFTILPVAFIPIWLFRKQIYPWMRLLDDPHVHDHALHAKSPLFSEAGFIAVAVLCFVIWYVWANRLRFWSLKQDETGAAECTQKMRVWTGTGIFLFAVSFTFGVIMWQKSLFHQWFSTMYGVYYFAGSVWMTVSTIYVITLLLKRQGPLRDVMKEKQFYFLGSIQFAFTVFYAYVTFSQYFIIWNANLPEETFWYWLREQGGWWQIGQLMIFGHFFVPFLTLLRIDAKLKAWVMIPFMIWAWTMHFFDLQFNIMPLPHPNGIDAKGFLIDLGCMAFFIGLVMKLWLKNFLAHPPYPQRDPRMAEGLDIYVAPASSAGLKHAK
jgi:hypothetical protein